MPLRVKSRIGENEPLSTGQNARRRQGKPATKNHEENSFPEADSSQHELRPIHQFESPRDQAAND